MPPPLYFEGLTPMSRKIGLYLLIDEIDECVQITSERFKIFEKLQEKYNNGRICYEMLEIIKMSTRVQLTTMQYFSLVIVRTQYRNSSYQSKS